MRLKTLRTVIAIAGLATAATIPIATPVEARILLSECERWAWDDCEASYGPGRINNPGFAECYEAKRIEYCGPPPVQTPGNPWYPLWPCDNQQGCPISPPVSPTDP